MKDSVHVRLGIIHGHLGEGNLSGGVGSPVQKRHVCLIGSCIRDIQVRWLVNVLNAHRKGIRSIDERVNVMLS